MKKGEKLAETTERHQQKMELWGKIVNDFTIDHVPVPTIARNYKNPATNKNYTTNHVYWILRQMGVMI